jgi:hypothetical protein
VVKGVRLLGAVGALVVPLSEDPLAESGLGDSFWLELGLVDQVIEGHQRSAMIAQPVRVPSTSHRGPKFRRL